MRVVLALVCLVATVSRGEAQPSLPGSCTSFTDSPLQAGVTIKTVHVTQLRACIADLRAARALPPVSWTDPVLTPQQTVVRAIHLAELRAALDSVYVKAGSSPPRYGETPVATITVIRAIHFTEVRAAIAAVPRGPDPPSPPGPPTPPSPPDEPEDRELVFLHTDAIGSVRMITDPSGSVLRRYDYLPDGQVISTDFSGAPWNRVQFAGKERDAETGFGSTVLPLDYFGARYYQAQIGRFTNADPVLDIDTARINPQTWNRYAYVRNNPLRYIDPQGAEITTPLVFQQQAFTQQVGANLQAFSKVIINFARAINSPGHLTPEAEARYFEQPESVAEASRMQFFDLALTAASALFGRRGLSAETGALRSVTKIDDVIASPGVLRGGVTPEQLMSRLGNLPETWRVETLGKGGAKGEGFVLREYKLGPKKAEPTGRQIRWHPGGGHHGVDPYWRVIDYNTVSEIIQ